MQRLHKITVRKSHRSQQGAVLIVSLLILLVMTIIGVTSMQTTVLEERMASNIKERNVALQSAEVALRKGESYIEALASTGGFGGSGPYFNDATTEPDPFLSSSWSSTNSAEVTDTITGVQSQPRYVIKQVGVIPGPAGSLNIGGYGGGGSNADVTTFRITARGVGGSDATQVILQSYYGRIF